VRNSLTDTIKHRVKPSYNRSDESFNEQLAAGRNMLALNQASSDITPRNIYGPRNGSIDSYGFPTQYSAHSSMSSASGASGFPYYSSHNPSIDGSIASSSITDYSSEAENLSNRTLPVPGQLMGTPAFPPEPSSMMTQFNSKLAGATQKKHKCKICDKRFTRPSSLQTHMYSHTGEKRKSSHLSMAFEISKLTVLHSICVRLCRLWPSLLRRVQSPSSQEVPSRWQ